MKKVQDNQGSIESYKRYKMYKSGKNWVYSAIAVGTIATGISFTTTNVHADSIKNNIQQSEQISSSKQTEQQSTVSLQTKDNTSSKENNPTSLMKPNTSDKEVTTANKTTKEKASELGNRSNIKNNAVNAQKAPADATNISNDNKAGRITSSLKNGANLKGDSLNGERNSTSKQDTPNNNVTAKVSSFGIDQTKQRNNALVTSKKITNNKQNMLSNSNSGVTVKTAKVALNNNDSKKLTNNIKNRSDVPAQYLANAKAKGPFTAGVNQVIPFEAFGGDGMLTRLLLNGSEKAAWSDNGTGKNAAILPITGLKAGEYFYEVDLGGNAKGKEGQALLDQLRSNGTKTYDATVKIYGIGADGKADTTKVVATKKGLRITINVGKNNITTSESKNNITDVQKFTSKNNKEKQSNKNSTISGMKETQSGKTNNSLMTTNTNVKKTDNRRMPDQNNSHILNREVSKNHSDKMDIQKESMLPQTGEKSNSILNIIGIALLGLVALVGSVFKLGKKKSD